MIAIAFYKGLGRPFDEGIRVWTNSKYSHCEIVFSSGECFSSSPRDGGTRFKHIDVSNGDWDLVEIPMTEMQELRIRNFCMMETGCRYDWIGLLFTQFLPLSFENPYWWFCSEVVVAALQEIGMLTLLIAHEVDPGELYNLLKLYSLTTVGKSGSSNGF